MRTFFFIVGVIWSLLASAGEFEQGLAQAKTKNWVEAERYFSLHLKKNPSDAVALYNLGLCSQHQQNYVKAIWYFEKAYKFDPALQEAVLQIEYSHKKLNNLYTWDAPFSAFKTQIFRIKMNAWMWLCLNMSITLGVCIFMVFISKKYRKPAVFGVVLGSALLLFALFATYTKASALEQLSHGIMTRNLENVYVDKHGNGLMPYTVRAGERVELVEKDQRTGIRFSNGLVAWVEPDQVSLY